MPKTHEYGLSHKSGEIRIAFMAGNDGMRHKLYGGVILGSSDKGRTHAMYSIDDEKDWSDDFHTFSFKWFPRKLNLCAKKNQRVFRILFFF